MSSREMHSRSDLHDYRIPTLDILQQPPPLWGHGMMRIFMRKSWVLSLVAVFSSVLLGQSPLGTVTGVATDASGAPIPNATVVVANQNTGVNTRL